MSKIHRMKYFLLILSLCMTCSLNAQAKKRKAKPKPEVFVEIEGGYFSHSKLFANFDNEFAGVKAVSLGYAKIKNKRKTGFSVGVNLLLDEYITNTASFDEKRSYSTLQYNRAFEILNKNKTRLFVGGFTGVLFEIGSSEPRSSFGFPTRIIEFGINVGPQFQFIQEISDDVSILFGTKVALFEASFDRYRYENPTLPAILQERNVLDFSLTERFNVNLGVSIKM